MVLTNDYELDIATGTSRTCREWVNRKWKWSEFVERCSRSKDTGETLEEYHHVFTADRRGACKDVGGFVGGSLRNGIRKAGYCIRRSMATLDIDDGTPDVWARFLKAFNCAGLLYSTHSYTPEKPRFRLIIPFNRSVIPFDEYSEKSEYKVVVEIIAQKMGPELFDKCSFEAERLLYWPSHPTDIAPIFECRDAPALNVDELLKEPLPVETAAPAPAETARRIYTDSRAIRGKMEDPATKNGIIGAFCRTYTIEEAIDTFLTKYYVRVDKKGYPGENPRYTNIGSETTGGLICYEGKYACSHHAHDPANFENSGQREHNAFDLCRIRLFGDLDKGKNPKEPTKLPSYKKMEEMALHDKGVQAVLKKERAEKARKDFDSINFSGGTGKTKKDAGEKGESSDSWKKDLGNVDKEGACKKTLKNLQLIVLNDPEFKKVGYNIFTHFDELTDTDCEFRGVHPPVQVDDISLSKMCVHMEVEYGITVNQKEVIEKMLQPSADKRAFNPVKNYITREEWDGEPRIDTLLVDYLGAEDTPLNRTVIHKWMIGAIRRALETDAETFSGVKMDYTIVLFGPQGTGKSTFIETLAGRFKGSISLTDNRKAQGEILEKSWIVELPEMKGIKSSETDSIKDLLTAKEDQFRPAYGRMVVNNPRHCAFIGSTNNRYFLKDYTGERRFWPVEIKGNGEVSEWAPKLKKECAQLWAEAYTYYKNGEVPMLSKEQAAEMEERCKSFSDIFGDDFKDALENWLNQKIPSDWDSYTPREKSDFYKKGIARDGWNTTLIERTWTTVYEIRLCMDYSGVNRYSPRRIEAVLQLIGWGRKRKRVGAKKDKDGHFSKVWGWEKPQDGETPAFETEPAL